MGFWAYHDARDIMQMLVMLLFATANQNPEKFCFFTTSYVSHATYEVLKLKHADEVRVLTVTKENLRHFQDTNLRLFAQNARPRWMGKPLSPPILPGNVCFPEDFYSDWGKTLKKFETKFQRKVNKYLPSLIESLDSSIMKKRNENLEKVISSVIDTSPGQKRRAEAIFLCLCSRTERVPLPGSRQRRHHPTSSASGSSDNSFSSWTWIFKRLFSEPPCL